MNREIKFRVWDGNQMLANHEINGDWLLSGNYGSHSVMQYTGLEDKNGVPIYEGDILGEGQIYKSRFEVVWDDKWCKYKLDCKRVCAFIQYPEWNRGVKMTIIGNIYSNPDLLK